jgi:hypothetical protein
MQVPPPYTPESIQRAKEIQHQERMAILRELAVPSELIGLYQTNTAKQMAEWNVLCAALLCEEGR